MAGNSPTPGLSTPPGEPIVTAPSECVDAVAMALRKNNQYNLLKANPDTTEFVKDAVVAAVEQAVLDVHPACQGIAKPEGGKPFVLVPQGKGHQP
jgi:hypothetical protein